MDSDNASGQRKRDRLYGFAAATYKQYWAGDASGAPSSAKNDDDDVEHKASRKNSLAQAAQQMYDMGIGGNLTVSGTRAEGHGQSFAGHIVYNNFNSSREDTDAAVRKASASLPLTFPEQDRQDLIMQKHQVVGTCEWISQLHQYQCWLGGDGRLLWICGEPGKGKTVLSLSITEQLVKIAADSEGSTQVLYYFCNFDDERRNKAVAVLRGLIYQLIQSDLHNSKSTLLAYFDKDQRLDEHLPHRETLWTIFVNLLIHRKLVLCMIDGLDQCDDDSAKWLAKRFTTLLHSKEARGADFPLQLILSSTHMKELKHVPTIMLEKHEKEINEDIERVIQSCVQQLSFDNLQGFTDEHRKTVETTLFSRADEGFLWVGLVIEELLDKEKTSEVMYALDHLPPGVNALFRRTLVKIPRSKRSLYRAVLEWATLAARPLSLAELGAATGIEASPPYVTVEQAVRDELATCDTLLSTENETVRIKTRTVQDYLMDDEWITDEDDDVAAFRINRKHTHRRLASRCLTYITRNMETRALTIKEMKELPLLEYSVYYWTYHMRLAGEVAKELLTEFSSFFSKRSTLRKNWWTSYKNGRRVPFPHMPPLHKASYFGIIPWMAMLMDEKKTMYKRMVPRSLSERSGSGTLPLSCAVAGGHEDAVRELLERGAGTHGTWSFTASAALHTAAEYGHSDIVSLLLKRGAKIDAKRHRNAQTPLHMAAAGGHEEVTRLLIAEGSDVHARALGRRTPLHEAAAYGKSAAVIRLLVDAKADVNATAETFTSSSIEIRNTPLHEAVLAKYEGAVRQLLECGADPNADPGISYSRPLHRALPNKALVEILVEHGAKVELCPLLLNDVARRPFADVEPVLDYLLAKGAKFIPPVGGAWPALHQATYLATLYRIKGRSNWATNLTLFLEKGADPNWQGAHGVTVLMELIKDFGNKIDAPTADVAKLLIEHGADVTIQDEKGRTALFFAKKYHLTETTKLFQDRWPQDVSEPDLSRIDTNSTVTADSDEEAERSALKNLGEFLASEPGVIGLVDEPDEQAHSDEYLSAESGEED